MSLKFYTLYEDTDLDEPNFYKKTHVYNGVQHYLKSLTVKDDNRILIEVSDFLKAKKFSLRDVIQMTLHDIEDEDFAFDTAAVRSKYVNKFISSLDEAYVVAMPVSLDVYAYNNRSIDAVTEAIISELKRQDRYKPLVEETNKD